MILQRNDVRIGFAAIRRARDELKANGVQTANWHEGEGVQRAQRSLVRLGRSRVTVPPKQPVHWRTECGPKAGGSQ